jgi:DNA-binding transcriptional ArsR family regulator
MGNDRRGDQRRQSSDTSDIIPQLDDDAVYRALASTRRRRLLAVLLDGKERSVAELATILAGLHATETGAMVSPEDRTRIMIQLHHAHLPQLDEAGLIAYDREECTARLEQLDDAVAELLRRSVERDGEVG